MIKKFTKYSHKDTNDKIWVACLECDVYNSCLSRLKKYGHPSGGCYDGELKKEYRV